MYQIVSFKELQLLLSYYFKNIYCIQEDDFEISNVLNSYKSVSDNLTKWVLLE